MPTISQHPSHGAALSAVVSYDQTSAHVSLPLWTASTKTPKKQNAKRNRAMTSAIEPLTQVRQSRLARRMHGQCGHHHTGETHQRAILVHTSCVITVDTSHRKNLRTADSQTFTHRSRHWARLHATCEKYMCADERSFIGIVPKSGLSRVNLSGSKFSEHQSRQRIRF